MPNNYTQDTDTKVLTHTGDILWNTSGLTWATYTSWATHTLTTTVAETGATGTPLYYQTAIIDLGSTRTVYPEISYSGTGDVRAVIEYSTSNSDLSSASFLGKYTTDNALDTAIVVYDVLDYQDAGYTNEDSSTNSNYTAFTARYLRLTAFVEKFSSTTTRDIQTLNNFNWALKTDIVTETLQDVSVNADPFTLTFTNIGAIINCQITAHSETNKKLVPQIVNKTNKTIRVVDANTFGVSGVNATVDVSATGVPGNLVASTTGVGLA